LTRRPWLRHLLLAGLALGLALGLLELGARTLLPILRGSELEPGALRQRALRVAALEEPPLRQGQAPGWSRHYLLHPYLGFVRDPDAPRDLSDGRMAPEAVNAWGFFGPGPIRPAREGVVTVAVLGGSFAMELELFAGDVLRDALAARPDFAGQEVELVNLALEGMKQPQQLLALQYVLALGSHIDYVVDLDGFNEVVLPLTDNRPFGVATHYPRAWPLFASRGLDVEAQVRLGRLSGLAKRRREAARALTGSWRRRSALALLLWSIRDGAEAKQAEAVRAELREHLRQRGRRHSLQEAGPPDGDADEAATRVRAVGLWRRGSEELARLTKAHGIVYLHALQPNQYFAPGRHFTAWERKNAFADEGHDYRRLASAGYPALVTAGERIAAQGIPFVDLTGIFDAEPESVYRDRCCHLNERGYSRVALAIADRLGR